MRHPLSALLLTLAAILLASCSETEVTNTEFDDWQARNEAYFSQIYQQAVANPERYHVIRNWSLETLQTLKPEDNVIAEVLHEGTGQGTPMYTDTVSVHYRGAFMPTESYPRGITFDQSWTGEYNLDTMVPVEFAVSGVVDGFATALQYMHPGDRWRVYIPYQLGYGETGTTGSTSSIPGYTTLVFDLTLVGYHRPDSKTED